MLSKRTTFIVGAGASKSYRLPTARDLYADAVKLKPESGIYQLIWACRVDANLLDFTIQDLRGHGGPTIDEFIEHRRHAPKVIEIAKLMIAALLGEGIQKATRTTGDDSDDWIRNVIETVSRGVPNAKQFAEVVSKNLSLVTFNFDSLIEDRTRAIIEARYAGDPDVQRAIDSIQVRHVHGVVSCPPKETLYLGSVPAASGYTATGVSFAWVQWTKAAAKEIHLTQDEIDPPLLEATRACVGSCEVVCFLGFSFENNNIQKLGLPETGRGKQLFASTYKVPKGDRDRIENLGGLKIAVGGEQLKCLALLHGFYVLQDL